MADEFDGALLRRGDPGYEVARRAAMWNALVPDRFPDAVVQAASEEDAVRAVRLARDEGLRIAVRSGGHSWAGNHVRDGGLLLDVSRLDEVTVDPAARTATVGPGRAGTELLELLAEHDLFFPAGHCVGVCVGGYLLQGGFGWNGRVHGPACQSVEAIDVVTADGELVRADADQHPDLYWAARGSGPGFFGVVTRFHLRCQPKPNVVANAVYLYPLDALEEVFTWAAEIGPQVARTMELMLFLHRDEAGEVEIAVTGPVLADTDEEADEVLAILESCPARARAKLELPNLRVTMADLFAGSHAVYPDDHRYAVDNMWTHAPIADLLPGLRAIAESLPPAPSHFLWMNWDPLGPGSAEREDMAFSVEDTTYLALYAVWDDPARDAERIAWATGHMRAMAPHASGIQLADENLGRRPARFITDEKMRRLDAIRGDYDPEERFHPWMGRL
ncbi:MAG: FAD-binding oxidoreductase [Solirubrobacteraceae bacterium]|nr:FAD-binding oxidoreductase [Solirubrobacteraceae bacterium]